MRLTRHDHSGAVQWAADGKYLASGFTLSLLAQSTDPFHLVASCLTDSLADGPLLAPIDSKQELWAAGVTYLRSRTARAKESDIGARLYEQVYDSDRPELFFKSIGHRVVGDGGTIRIRRDSDWNVPEPELVLLTNNRLEIIGYTAGNDVSSRSIEGANALFLPQAKIYDGSAAIGPGIELAEPELVRNLPIHLQIRRAGATVFEGETSSAKMKRRPDELCRWLGAEMSFPDGVLLMTGTGLVPADDFTLRFDDEVIIRVGEETLRNVVT